MAYDLNVLHPVAVSQGDIDRAELAQVPQSLEGKRVGLLWNAKRGGEVALRRAGEMLQERFQDCQVIFYPGMMPAPKAIMERAKQECDVVIGATAD
jgi:hypothetical protein|tara:strand:+ start:213 stop:500 length:288 start_codon:yes stop_codon:yes gene_type:complete